MRRNAAPAVSARLAASLLCLCAAPALAGDAALFDFIGFSEDGRLFRLRGIRHPGRLGLRLFHHLSSSISSPTNGSPARPFHTQAPEADGDRPLATRARRCRWPSPRPNSTTSPSRPRPKRCGSMAPARATARHAAFAYGPFAQRRQCPEPDAHHHAGRVDRRLRRPTGTQPVGFTLSARLRRR